MANGDVTNPETPQDGEDETQSHHQTGAAVRWPRPFGTAGPPFPEKKKYILTALSLFYKRREENIPHVICSSSLMSYYITYLLMPGLIL